MDKIIEKLKNLGFNSYEAKVYLALLKKYPATGYEIAQMANIPQSRAYDAIKSLIADKYVISNSEKPQTYYPVSPKELTQRYKRKMNSTIEFLEKKLPKVKDNYNEPIYSIEGYDDILEKVKEIINHAKNSIYLEVWEEDFKHIQKEIEQAYDRGSDIKIVAFGNIKTHCGLVYHHDGAKEIENSIGARMIFVLGDSTECIFGRVESDAIWSKNSLIALLLKEFIVHDMYLLDVGKNFPEQLRYFYGAGFKRLKDKILSQDSSYNIH